MASRHLKRLQEASKEDEIEGISEEEEQSPVTTAKPNLFSLLNEDETEDEEGDNDANEEPADESAGHKGQETLPQTKDKKQSKQKGKSSKKKAVKTAKGGNEKAPAAEEDLDKILQSLDITIEQRPASGNGGGESSSEISRGLEINLKRLKTDDELRRIFGSKFVASERGRDSEEGQSNFAHASRKVRRLAARGLIRRAKLKPGYIIPPRDDWPPLDGSLSMTTDKESPLPGCFKYVHTARYQAAHQRFEEAQASHDPNQLVQLISFQPYHVDTLIAVSDLYRVSGQNETADDFLARSLYALEGAWPQNFKPGQSVLNPALPENKAFFQTHFKYIQTLMRRGLYTTALENAKLLLSTNALTVSDVGEYNSASDCLDICLCIDYIALRAGHYTLLKELEEFSAGNGTLQHYWSLPHWRYSRALAEFLQQEPTTPGCRDAGIVAVQQTPSMALAMIDRLLEKGCPTYHNYKEVSKHKLFKDACEHDSASLSHLETLFVERQYTLYKESKIHTWLFRCCKEAVESSQEQAVKDWMATRKEWWPPSKTNDYSRFRLSDFTDDVAALPQDELPNGLPQVEGIDDAHAEAHAQILEVLENMPPEEQQARLLDIANTDPQHPFLVALQEAGVDIPEFARRVREALDGVREALDGEESEEE